MVSLETLTPFHDKPIELGQFQLISPRSPTFQYICHFQWIFGLEYGSFPFTSELNIMSVSKDIREYLEKGSLILIPTADVLERAYDMLIYNDNPSREPDERKRFEEFGTGPWEYTILPGRWDRKTNKIRSLPPLFNCSSDGAHIPFFFEDCEYDNLPRFTSVVHPLIVIMLHRMNRPYNHPTSERIQEKLISPLKKVLTEWPEWQHNRFLPFPNTKFKREYKAQKIVCRCVVCSKNDSGSSTASSLELEDTCTDAEDEEEGRKEKEEYKVLSRIANERVAAWRGCLEGVAFIHDDLKHDNILDRYAQESTDAAYQVMLRQEEEKAKREALAAGSQGDFPFKKKSRLS